MSAEPGVAALRAVVARAAAGLGSIDIDSACCLGASANAALLALCLCNTSEET
jgi:hypothetical protein